MKSDDNRPVHADELDISKRQLSSGFVKFRKITADNNLGINITPQTAGNTDVYFTVPADTVWCPGKCKFRGLYTPTAGGAGRYNMIHINAPVFFNVCELYDDLNNYLQKANYVNKSTHMMAPWKASMSDYLQRSGPQTLAGVITSANRDEEWLGVPTPCNTGCDGSVRFNFQVAGVAGAASFGKRAYISPLYLLVGAVNDAGPEIPFSFRMADICPNSIWSMMKNIYYGPTRVLHIHLGLDQSTRYGFTSGDQDIPTAGAAALAGAGAFSNFWFECAIESDANVVANTKKLFFEQGISYLVPYTKVIRPTQSGQQQTAQVQISRADGIALKEIFVSTYNVTETGQTSFDNSQITLVATTVAGSWNNPDTYGAKISTYHTEWNSIQIQPNELNLANMDDWRYNEEFLKGSSIDCIDSYYFNWSHAEIFDQHGPICRKEIAGIPVQNIMGGFSLADGAISLYNFVATVPAGAINGYTPSNGLLHYIAVTTYKELKVNLETVYFA